MTLRKLAIGAALIYVGVILGMYLHDFLDGDRLVPEPYLWANDDGHQGVMRTYDEMRRQG